MTLWNCLSIQKITQTQVALALLFFLSACAGNSQGQFTDDKTNSSNLVFVAHNADYGFVDVRIDGRRVARSVTSSAETINARSGERNLAFGYLSGWFAPVGTMTGIIANFEPNKAYEIHARITEENEKRFVWVWAIDKATGKVIAGHLPSVTKR